MSRSEPEVQEHPVYEIYILRHGIAEPRGSGVDDSARKLTAEGRQKMRQIATGLKRLGIQLDGILTSPLARALETAQVVSKTLGVSTELCDELRPGEPAPKVLSLLAKHPERKRVLLVGHEPDLSLLAGRLLGVPNADSLALKKGGCCLIISDNPAKSQGQLVWWLTPQVLRAMA